MTRDVVLATCAEFPEGEPSEQGLVPALDALEVRARWVAWDDQSIDWSRAPVVVRSTWDYTARRDQFLAWTRAVPVLHNPAGLLAWNSDKTYLRDLADAGLPVVPTAWVPPGAALAAPGVEFVVKPSVGAGSRGVGRFAAAGRQAAIAHVETLHRAGRTVMVQPYQAGVDAAGETALIYFAGTFSHSIRKAPMLAAGAVHDVEQRALFVEERISPRDPSGAELAVGAQVVAFLAARGPVPLFARVDLLPGPDGPVVVELELTEPSLFLASADGAAERFAAAIAQVLA